MITAQQARELRENKPVASDTDISAMIQRRANSGYNYGWVIDKYITEEQLIKLKELGYVVKKDDTDNSFCISW